MTLPTLTAVGDLLDDDKSSFEGAVFKGPAEPLGAVLEGTAEPLEAVLEGSAEALEAVLEGSVEPLTVSELFAGSHGTRASASTSRGKPECRPIPIRARQKNAPKIELS